ncbi:MAG: twin-arginine translocase TatA/TatE family subunit [Phycisphaerales bacterium]|nr:twin-arginine translocase TatA/TatE family subunit [Phycisphaerales bacterium]
MPQGWEWLIIFAIMLLLFGKRLPEVGRSLGKGITEFRKGVKSVYDEVDGDPTKPRPASPASDPRSLPQQGPGIAPAAPATSESAQA